MCGFVCVLNKDLNQSVDKGLLNNMTNIIEHRGPDESGVYLNANIGMGHRRLSILDVSSGHQPMKDEPSGNVIVYNGEIYNHLDLRDSLTRKGTIFKSSCDTETLLYHLDEENADNLNALNGMFTFAFWNEHSRNLYLARDRVGKKPLYYVDLKDKILFASEIKSLLLHPDVKRETNLEKTAEYLLYRTVAGTDTFFKGIQQIPAGCYAKLLAPDYKMEIKPYWDEDSFSIRQDMSVETAMDEFSSLLNDAVKARLISDVPVGTFNSGGVDSSLISAIVRHYKTDELHTFSAGFEEESHDERRYAQIVANKLGTNHHTLVMDEYDYCKELEDTLWHLEEPINHAHTVQILHLSKLAKQYVTVVLTGEGADEIFAGYPRYNLSQYSAAIPYAFRSGLSRLMSPIAETLGLRRVTKMADMLSLTDEALIKDNARYTPLYSARQLYKNIPSFACRDELYRKAVSQSSDRLMSQLYFDQRTYLPSLLMRLDKMSMGASIEARVPFLDHRILEWSHSLPSKFKLRGFTNKWIVKKYAERWLPEEIVYRKKEGFGAPISEWMRNPDSLGKYLDLLTESKSKQRGIFEQKVVERLIKEHRTSERDHSEILWGLMNLELWQRKFIDVEGL